MHPKFLHETAKNISIPLAISFKYIHGNDEIASILEGSKCNTSSQKRTKKLSRKLSTN
jgi:hypothetical protein